MEPLEASRTAARPVSVALWDASAVEPLMGDWARLAACAIEPNPFFEPWFLRPAIKAFGDDDVRLLTVRVDGTLALLVPVLATRRVLGLPMSGLRTFRHDYDPLGTPLVHRDYAAEAVGALLDGAAGPDAGHQARVLLLTDVRGDGAFRAALIEALRARQAPLFVVEAHTRALFRPAASADAFVERIFSTRQLKDLRRRERRLAETGAVEYGVDCTEMEGERFAAEFLAVEASGWKGEGGTALASKPVHRAFFEEVLRGAARERKLEGLWLRVGGAPVAMFCAVRGGPELFAWKVAYDERFAKMSPGILLELENIRRLHEPERRCEMDSCATPDHELSNRLWPDRRILESVVLPLGATPVTRLAVAALPLLQWAKRQARAVRDRKR